MTSSWHRRPLMGFDLETTGVDPEQDRIVTACAVRYGGGRPTCSRTWVCDAGGVEIPPEATDVHGYTTEMAREAGRPTATVVAEITGALVEAVEQGLPIVAMNASFDLTLLDREARRWGVIPLWDLVTPYVIDPRVLDKELDRYRRGRRTLSDLCRHYVVRLEDAHSAASDAIAACALTWKIAKRYPRLAAQSLPDLHAAQMRWAAKQAEGLRQYFASHPDKAHLAAGVRCEWPLIPAADLAGEAL